MEVEESGKAYPELFTQRISALVSNHSKRICEDRTVQNPGKVKVKKNEGIYSND